MLILQVKNLGMFAAALFTYNPYDNAQIIHVAKIEKKCIRNIGSSKANVLICKAWTLISVRGGDGIL